MLRAKTIAKRSFNRLVGVLLGLAIYYFVQLLLGNIRITNLGIEKVNPTKQQNEAVQIGGGRLELAGYVQVVRDVDGDTFVYKDNNGEKTVRLLGVDTPETKDPRKAVQCFGKEASAETAELIVGKIVRLESDPKAQNLDKYGRELRYVYLEDGRMLNRILVSEGFAHATPQYSFLLKEEFVKLEKEANISSKGMWSKSACN